MAPAIENNLSSSPSESAARFTFVLRYGVLGWGLTTGLVFALMTDFTEGAENSLTARLVGLAISLSVFALAGILWGRMMWWFLKRFGAKQKVK